MAMITYNTHVLHANQKAVRLLMVSPFQPRLVRMTEGWAAFLLESERYIEEWLFIELS